MLTILFGIIIGIVVMIYDTYKKGYLDSWGDYVLASIFGTSRGLFLGVIVAFMLPMDSYYKQYSFNIETLQDNSSVNGSFFLASGQIEGKMKYIFYYEDNGLYKMEQLDYEKVSIRYSDSVAKVNVTEKYPTESFINKFALDWDIFSKTYVIEVPIGTIKNNYNLDAQ